MQLLQVFYVKFDDRRELLQVARLGLQALAFQHRDQVFFDKFVHNFSSFPLEVDGQIACSANRPSITRVLQSPRFTLF
jgi:hypothetical protein